jgi:sulfonate transport system ATP-binding protein
VTTLEAPPIRLPEPLGTAPVVEVEDAERAFDDHVVLDGVSLRIAPGEFVALLGRSGSGKSTLLRAMAGLDDRTTGIRRVPERKAVAFQEHRLFPWLRVAENVHLGLKGPDRKEAAARALAEVGLEAKARAWPLTLSGGEAQRASLARALVREPDLLLLDEPFGALDALTRIKMHGLLADLCRRHQPAVLFVTHDVDEAITLADRVTVLTDGKLSLDLPVELDRPRDPSQPGFSELRRRLLHELGVDLPGPA